jgi:hypothetical protein
MAKMVHSDVNRIRLSKHALEQAVERGVTEAGVKEAVRKGSCQPAARGRELCRYNFAFNRKWQPLAQNKKRFGFYRGEV